MVDRYKTYEKTYEKLFLSSVILTSPFHRISKHVLKLQCFNQVSFGWWLNDCPPIICHGVNFHKLKNAMNDVRVVFLL